MNEVDPNEQLDEDVEEILLDIADEFVENVVSSACAIAKHRNSTSLEVDDVKLYLERKYKIWIPGFGETKPAPKKFSSEAHRQRMALINKQDNKTPVGVTSGAQSSTSAMDSNNLSQKTSK